MLPILPVAVLLGLAAGWQWCGMQMILASAIDPLPATTTMVGAIALLTAAVGPWLPERLVLGVARFIRQRSRRWGHRATDLTGTFWMLRAVRERDESLLWLALAVLATTAGVVSLATLALTPVAIGLYHLLLDEFFWTDLTLAVLEWGGVALLIGVSWIIHGVMAATLAPVAGASGILGRRPPGVVAGALLGLGVAWLTHELWADWGLSARQVFMAGVLVMFVLAGVSARSSLRAERHRIMPSEVETLPPEVTGGAEGLIWLSLVVWGVAAVLAGGGWLACRAAGVAGPGATSGRAGWYMLATVLGMAVASIHGRRRNRSASGCGMAAWTAGLGAGTAATFTSYGSTEGTPGAVQILLVALPFGYALHYAERAWLARVGSETLGFAQLMSALLAGLGLGLIGMRWWALPMLGPMGTLTAGALVMLAAGGLMQVYEEDRPARTRHLRLTLVFASLAGAMLVFPADAKRWARWTRQQQPPAPQSLGLEWLSADALPSARRVCLIGLDPALASRWSGLGPARVDIMPLSPGSRADVAKLPRVGRTRIYHMSAFRALRLERPGHDLVYQRGAAGRPVDRFAEYSVEWLTRLARHTSPNGRVVVDVPLAGMTADAVAVIAATFEHAMQAPARWMLVPVDGQPGIRLAAVPGTKDPMPNDDGEAWCPVEWLLADRPGLRPHSIQRDRMTRALNVGASESVPSPGEWLRQCRAAGRAARQVIGD